MDYLEWANSDKCYEAIAKGKAKYLCQILFGDTLTEGQVEIVKGIVFDPEDKLCISAFTRYGKTWAVSKAVLLWVWINPGHEVPIIGPQYSQASKLREYIADDIIASPVFSELIDSPAGQGTERLRKEVSKKNLTFKNGSRIRILSGEGSGDRLMGHGGQLLVIDESALLEFETYRTKISRMKELADGGRYKEVHISNPWHRHNQFHTFWEDPTWRNIHIGYEQGIRENRISPERVEEQRKILTDIEFQILYKSMFPESREDALIKYDNILKAVRRPGRGGVRIHGLDVAEKGSDLTILSTAERDKDFVTLLSQKLIDRDDTMHTVSDVKAYVSKQEQLNIDSIGVGAGVHSRLDELGYNAVSVRVGRAPTTDSDRFLNQKAEFYWNLKDLFDNGLISIPEEHELIKQLSSIRWELTSGGKIKIIDPPKSPDYADSLMLACAQTKKLRGGIISVDL